MALVVYIEKGSFTSKQIKPFMIVPLSEMQEVDLHKTMDKRDFNIEGEKISGKSKSKLILLLGANFAFWSKT